MTEQFEGLAKVVLKSQQVPDSVAVLIRGNPELFSDDEIVRISEQVLRDIVSGLTKPRGV